MREIIKVSKNNPDQKIIEKTSKLLKAGKIVVLPTDTVYGLCIKAEIENSIEKLSEIKGRPPKKGVPLIIGKIDQLFDYTNPISAKKLEFLKCFWPGPVTFVFERKKISNLRKMELLSDYQNKNYAEKLQNMLGHF